MRVLLAIVLCLVASAARAASPTYPCPTFVAGWALSGTGPITAISWDPISQQMYFVWNYAFVSDYYPVPNSSVMQTFSSTPQANWVQTFNYIIAPSYHAVLLKEKDNCPVLQDGYYLPACPLSDEDEVLILATETGAELITENPVCVASPGGFVWVN